METSPRNPYSYQALAAMEWQAGDRSAAREVLAEGPRYALTDPQASLHAPERQ